MSDADPRDMSSKKPDDALHLPSASVEFRLISLGSTASATTGWDVHTVPPTVLGVAEGLAKARQDNAKVIAIWDSAFPTPQIGLATDLLNSRADVWHSGLSLGLGNAVPLMTSVVPATVVSLPMPAGIECLSWRMDLRATLIRGEVLEQSPGSLDPAFATIEGAGLDLGFRWMRAGVIPQFQPKILVAPTINRELVLPLPDQLRLIVNSFGVKWAIWAVSQCARPGRQWLEAVRHLRHHRRRVAQPQPYVAPVRDCDPPKITTVSVIIPTIGRPQQLERLLSQLGTQTRPPDEVVVADQNRHPQAIQIEAPTRVDKLPLTVCYLPTRGQSTARNAAILTTSGDVVIFIDDDVEVDSDLVEKHVATLNSTGADAIAGAYDVRGEVRDDMRLTRMAEVFPGGNSSARRSALERSGLFDPVFDNGPRADADLGVRLMLTGALVLYAPSIRAKHHHSMQGGLRTINVRKITRASSRASLTQRHLPAPTQLYLGLRHWGRAQTTASITLILVSTLSGDGPVLRRLGRFIIQAALLPNSRRQTKSLLMRAEAILNDRPAIPRP